METVRNTPCCITTAKEGENLVLIRVPHLTAIAGRTTGAMRQLKVNPTGIEVSKTPCQSSLFEFITRAKQQEESTSLTMANLYQVVVGYA